MEAAGGDEGCRDPIWSATTNWVAAGGRSLGDAISFDTSAAIDDEEQKAKPIILLRPEGDDPPPCEITICFRKKHEIYQVYVRSTARIYEIYFSSNNQDSCKEYLCTVRCGAAIKEVVPESITVGATNGCPGNISNGTVDLPDKVVRSSSNSSDEDGWVQVKAPDSLLQHDKEYFVSGKCDDGIDSPKLQIHYEATAEISDSSPCVSLTLRMLSIQTQACVHVEEIYVYADPVESSDSDPPVPVGENLGGSSLLAMLVPSLMHLSKSDTSQNKRFYEEATVSTHQVGTEITTPTVSSDMGNTLYSCKSPDQKQETEQERTSVKSEEVRSESIQKVTAPEQMSNSLADQNSSQSYNRIEKVLDELVKKVGRIENFCSKFEENMLKPLGCIEERLQQLEEKLDALAVKGESSQQCPCSRISSLESNGNDLKDKGANTNDTELREDSSFVATASPADEVEPSVPESQTRPGLIIKAPEFQNEDDNCSNTEDTVDPVEDILQNNKPLSIDSALASSLAAFLTSTIKSPDPTPSVTAISQESVYGNNSSLDSLVVVPSEGADYLSDSIEDDDCDILGATSKGTGFGDTSLLSQDAAIVNDKLSADMKKDCGMLDEVTKKTTFNGSSSVSDAGMLSPIFPSLIGSGFILTAPEFLNKDSSLICDGTLDSPELDFFENRASLSTVRQAVPPLAKFLSLRTLSSPQSTPAAFSARSGLSRTDNSKLPASTGVVCERADASGIKNQEENEMEDDVYSDRLLSMLPLEASFEQGDHVGLGQNKRLSIEKTGEHLAANLHDCMFLASNAGFTLNCHDGSNSENDSNAGISLNCHDGSNSDSNSDDDSNAGFSLNCHDGSNSDNIDTEKASLRGFDQHGGEWTGGRSTASPIFHNNNSVNDRIESDLSVGGSSDSSTQILPITYHGKWRTAGNYESNPDFALEKIISHAESCAYYSCERSNKALEDMISNVKFTSDRNLKSGLPLELLLGVMPDAEICVASTSGVDGDGDGDEAATGGLQLHNSSSSDGIIDLDSDADGSLLSELPPEPYVDSLIGR